MTKTKFRELKKKALYHLPTYRQDVKDIFNCYYSRHYANDKEKVRDSINAGRRLKRLLKGTIETFDKVYGVK